MLGLLAPIWLAGLGALFVPIALHLWSRRGGRPIRVGSIRLLAGTPPATRRSWMVQEPWLLALRCAVLATLAVALTGPFWIPRVAGTNVQALVALDVRDRDALVDSLRRAGVSVSLLAGEAPAGGTINLWTALRHADRRAPPGTQVIVFAPDLLRYFRGERPMLSTRVEWHTRPAITPAAAVSTPPPARVVTIFAEPARLDDAGYVRAAIEAAGSATGIPAIVSIRPATTTAAVATSDWFVWLSARATPDVILEAVRRGGVLLSDAGAAPVQRQYSRVVTGSQPSDAWLTSATVASPSGAPVWSDGTGAPILTETRQGRGIHYRFYSRFFPGWGDFVLRPAFPLAMSRLWAAAGSPALAPDNRRMTVQQILPAQSPGRETASSPDALRQSLFLPFWTLAALLFLAERWMSRRPRRVPV